MLTQAHTNKRDGIRREAAPEAAAHVPVRFSARSSDNSQGLQQPLPALWAPGRAGACGWDSSSPQLRSLTIQPAPPSKASRLMSSPDAAVKGACMTARCHCLGAEGEQREPAREVQQRHLAAAGAGAELRAPELRPASFPGSGGSAGLGRGRA